MNIKVKKLHPDAVLPKQAYPTDAGYDIIAIDDGNVSKDLRYIEYNTGLSIAPPSGYHIRIHPRSSISNFDLILCNHIGLCDNSFRGAYICRFRIIRPQSGLRQILSGESEEHYKVFGIKLGDYAAMVENPEGLWSPKLYKKGDKIAQLVIEKTEYANFVETSELDETERGSGGFGSTGK